MPVRRRKARQAPLIKVVEANGVQIAMANVSDEEAQDIVDIVKRALKSRRKALIPKHEIRRAMKFAVSDR